MGAEPVTTDQISPRERIDRVWDKQRVDRVPFSVWQHFPVADQTATGLATAHELFQSQHQCDLVKFMPPGDYPIIDWGGKSTYADDAFGVRQTTHFPVNTPEDWARLEPVDVKQGFNGLILEALQITRARIDPSVPLFQTIFSPLTIAMKLSDRTLLQHISIAPDTVHAALQLIVTVTRQMLNESLQNGASGIFFATQCADESVMPVATYELFGLPYDNQVLNPLPPEAKLIVHIHGRKPMLELARQYPFSAFNWHDRDSGPSLAKAAETLPGILAGGLSEKTFATATAEAIGTAVREAVDATASERLIVAPGCVIPLGTPAENIASVRSTLQAIGTLAR